MPSIPAATRSFKICCCSAALAEEGIRKSTSTLPSSLAASLQPVRAIAQKFAALLLTNASLSFFWGAGAAPDEAVSFSFLLQLENIVATHTARVRRHVLFM